MLVVDKQTDSHPRCHYERLVNRDAFELIVESDGKIEELELGVCCVDCDANQSNHQQFLVPNVSELQKGVHNL